jgi:hypothetical protein
MEEKARIKIALVSGICLLALMVTLKSVLHVSEEILLRDLVLYVIIYGVFALLPWAQSVSSRSRRCTTAIGWSIFIVTMTLTIIGVNAFW